MPVAVPLLGVGVGRSSCWNFRSISFNAWLACLNVLRRACLFYLRNVARKHLTVKFHSKVIAKMKKMSIAKEQRANDLSERAKGFGERAMTKSKEQKTKSKEQKTDVTHNFHFLINYFNFYHCFFFLIFSFTSLIFSFLSLIFTSVPSLNPITSARVVLLSDYHC